MSKKFSPKNAHRGYKQSFNLLCYSYVTNSTVKLAFDLALIAK